MVARRWVQGHPQGPGLFAGVASAVRRRGLRWAVGGFAVAVLLLTVVLGEALDRPLGRFLKDPASITGSSPLTGFVSNLGMVLWTSAAAIAGFAAILLRERPGEARYARMLGLGAGLTTLLMLDDLFMLHEDLVPRLLGIPQVLVIGTYGLLTLAFLAGFRDLFASRRAAPLFLALGLFAVSAGADQLGPAHEMILVEDGCKFLGIAAWLVYFTETAAWRLRLPPGGAPSAAPA